MLSNRMKDMLDRLTKPIYGDEYDDRLLKIIDGGKPVAEYKKQRKMDEINSVKGQYDA